MTKGQINVTKIRNLLKLLRYVLYLLKSYDLLSCYVMLFNYKVQISIDAKRLKNESM